MNEDKLIGRTIVGVFKDEPEGSPAVTVLRLDNGAELWPSNDAEGNAPGVLFHSSGVPGQLDRVICTSDKFITKDNLVEDYI